MTEDQLRARINVLANHLIKARDKAPNKTEEELGEMLLIGLEIIGEVLIDIKRIASAAEQHNADCQIIAGNHG